MSAGWTPSVHLFSQSRGKVAFDDATKRFLPGTYAQDCVSVGACNGTDGLAGDRRARRSRPAPRRPGTPAASRPRPSRSRSRRREGWTGGMLGAGPGAGADTTVKAFVDFQNDVTAKDIRQAVREGMRSIEHVKRFTTNGMATDQGKTSNMHGLAIAAEALGKDDPAGRADHLPRALYAGHLRHHRQPCAAAACSTRRARPPTHDWAEAHGAVFEDVGQWKRAWYFPRAGEDMHAAVNRECVTVRKAAGLFDASTLGKIEVVGPDAAKFMELLYTNPWEKLEVRPLPLRHHAARGRLRL